jgi:sulfur carrier protein
VTIIMNGTPREVSDQATVAELLAQLNLRAQQVAVEVNRAVVPRNRHAQHVLASNDAVEIVTLVGGG